jgi:hypothetical protein
MRRTQALLADYVQSAMLGKHVHVATQRIGLAGGTAHHLTRLGHDADSLHESRRRRRTARKELTRMDSMLSESGTWPWPDSLDAVVAAPGSHRVLFERERTRVLEVTIGHLPTAGEIVLARSLRRSIDQRAVRWRAYRLTHAAEPGCQLVHQRIKIAVHVVLGRILIMHTGDLVCGASRAGRSLLRHREAGGWPSGIDSPSLLSTEFSTSSTSEAPETSFAMPTMSVQMARRVGPCACPTHPRECSSPAGFSTG